jgi:hypothetical protein
MNDATEQMARFCVVCEESAKGATCPKCTVPADYAKGYALDLVVELEGGGCVAVLLCRGCGYIQVVVEGAASRAILCPDHLLRRLMRSWAGPVITAQQTAIRLGHGRAVRVGIETGGARR